MASIGRYLRVAFGVFALWLVVAVALPAQAQQPSSVNPTASSVKEQQLLQELNRIQGRVSIPDQRSGVLEQPAGRDWRDFHRSKLPNGVHPGMEVKRGKTSAAVADFSDAQSNLVADRLERVCRHLSLLD